MEAGSDKRTNMCENNKKGVLNEHLIDDIVYMKR